MKHRKLINTVKKKYRKIDQLLNEVIIDFGSDNIHLFRLEVKKLRSLLQFSCAAKKKTINIPKKLRSFYHALGIIRSLQIQYQSIKDITHVACDSLKKTYLDFISVAIEKKLTETRKSITHKSPFAKEKRVLLSQLPNGIKQKVIRRFTAQHVSTLTYLMQPAYLSDKSLHTIRKLLKDILYTWALTAEPTALPSAIIMSKEEVHYVTEILGSFQDKCTGLDLLHAHYKKQHLSLQERHLWRSLENHWWLERERARENIHALFQKECFTKILLDQSSVLPQPRVFVL